MIDTSTIFAAIANEADGELYRRSIKTAPLRLISSVTLLETRIVLFARLGSNAIVTFDQLIERARIVVVPFDRELSEAPLRRLEDMVKGKVLLRS